MSDAQLDRTRTPRGRLPADHPEAWEKLALPADDLRVEDSSPYPAMGVR